MNSWKKKKKKLGTNTVGMRFTAYGNFLLNILKHIVTNYLISGDNYLFVFNISESPPEMVICAK